MAALSFAFNERIVARSSATLDAWTDAEFGPIPEDSGVRNNVYFADGADILTAQRMLPNAWRDCRSESADVAITGCKALLESGIAKDAELAEIQVWNGRALRDRNARFGLATMCIGVGQGIATVLERV